MPHLGLDNFWAHEFEVADNFGGFQEVIIAGLSTPSGAFQQAQSEVIANANVYGPMRWEEWSVGERPIQHVCSLIVARVMCECCSDAVETASTGFELSGGNGDESQQRDEYCAELHC